MINLPLEYFWIVPALLGAFTIVAFLMHRQSPAKFEYDNLGDPVASSPRQTLASTRRDKLSAAAVAPSSIESGAEFRLWIAISKPSEITKLSRQRAKEFGGDPSSSRQLSEKVSRGAVLTIVVNGTGRSAEAVQTVRWEGKPIEISYILRAPVAAPKSRALYDISIHLDRLCLGVIPLTLPVSATKPTEKIQSVEMHRPTRIFLSYSKPDRRLALEIGRAYNRVGIKTFIDRLSLEGGDRWEERLGQEIDRCDTFFLLWSEASSKSEWVCWEARRALARQAQDSNRLPSIITHIVGAPPPATPPEDLTSLQFNDPAFALWEQSIAEAKQADRQPEAS